MVVHAYSATPSGGWGGSIFETRSLRTYINNCYHWDENENTMKTKISGIASELKYRIKIIVYRKFHEVKKKNPIQGKWKFSDFFVPIFKYAG
jgi:hypothetical protein